MEKKKWSAFFGSFCIILIFAMLLLMVGWIGPAITSAASDKVPDKIRFGSAIALSGMNAMPADGMQVSVWKLWAEDTNAKGGILVPKYNKRIPVELVLYDDHSDIETSVKMFEKLILQDNVDFMLPPWGTAFILAAAPIAAKYQYPLIANTISMATLQEKLAHLPYLFVVLNQPPGVVKGTLDLMKELDMKSVAIFYVADQFGLEHWATIAPLIGMTDIKVPIFKAIPLGAPDLSILIKKTMSAKVDGVISFGYPDSTILWTKQMMALGYNPKFFFNGALTNTMDYRDMFGAAVVEGVIGMDAYNPKMAPPAGKKFYESYKKKWGKECNRGTEVFAYAALQFIEQAVEKVGDFDRPKIRDVIAKDTFNTVVGPMSFVDQYSTNLQADVGQWQKGEFEALMPKDKRTVKVEYPKPKWPSSK